MTLNADDDTLDLNRYQVTSRREIVNLLRHVGRRNQFVRMEANKGADSAVTAILEVDDAEGIVIIDCASSAATNQRLLESANVRFETMLENIRIQFSASQIAECEHDGRPALCIAIPQSVIRLQRREHYRVMTPVTTPVRCTIAIPDDSGNNPASVMLPLYNVSGGGISLVDEKKQVPVAIGTIYENARLELPGGEVTVAMQLMNSREIALSNGKQIQRLGFMFIEPTNAAVAAIQRYITKLEREQNARATGMG
ncbi:flagellar brake protein [Noviherbaspirillum cavernae]|uniref:Flagellar brake protein YcgR n=1 Tax=Noviherbaspirillum cavernae TaxID=2320862 RepID=A0A418X0J0_9BURK|nr:flagellar brake protein [Noviherbaspirillum cavernae]RJG05961.1 flagellar brake protein [Noviherbaspirillum cavernae]